MQPPIRRNDPCPCGSGLRYKECHGKLGASETAPAADALIPKALQLHQQGRIDEAERIYRQVLAADPGNAIATHYLGMAAWQRGDKPEAERAMRASIAANAGIADFHNNLGLLLRDTERGEEAVACFRKTLATDPAWIEAYNNLGLALEGLGRWDEALAAYRDAIARAPGFAAAHQNLGRALITLGRFEEGWERYRWRLLAQGAASAAPDAAAPRLAEDLSGRAFVLVAEQGLGDVLFFLRFAPELARRGARLAFQGDARLHSMLARTGLFPRGLAAPSAAPLPGEPIHVGDLPWLLGAHHRERFPPPLALQPLPERAALWREALAAFGPAPRIALTWRAGVAPVGPARTQLKEVAFATLARALAGQRATWVSVQRQPREGEREALEQALGARVHDCSALNDDLEDMLALLAVIDDYAGVSNANTHLRAAVGGSMQVFIPPPPEWRWGIEGPSPWFPAMRVVRLGAGNA